MKKIYLLAAICWATAISASEGELPGGFTINENGDMIQFSQGNLQYQASTQTWRFAEHQWDFVGDDENGNVYENETKCNNKRIAEYYEGWIDLFGWGTGQNPTNTSTDNSDYQDFTDWGINPIRNGGDVANKWRTPTHAEWNHIFYVRDNAENLRGQATVNDVHGYILLPDDWTDCPKGLTFTANPNTWTTNKYAGDDWKSMETQGAVFFPASGTRFGTNMENATNTGDYRMSTPETDVFARVVTIGETYARATGFNYRYYGFAIRLIKPYEKSDEHKEDIQGGFTIDKDGNQIQFSPGNLQYQASTQTWRFAEHPWDFVGDEEAGNVYIDDIKCNNAKISETYEGWIDLFGWGTSGYNNKYPYASGTAADEYAFTEGDKDIAGTNYDWGVYNKISNGGNQSGLWRLLTQKEWEYLFHGRTNAENLFGMGQVNGVNGTIILPDDWTSAPEGLTFTPSTTRGMTWKRDESDGFEYYFNIEAHNNFSHNYFSSDEWKSMADLGAVFLPCAGYRMGTDVYWVEYDGDYWTSTLYDTNYAHHISFYGNALYPQDNASRRYASCFGIGFAVRLVSVEDLHGIKGIQESAIKSHKFLRNGQILIERNGKIYTMQGLEAK